MAINQTAKQLGKLMKDLRLRAGVSTYDIEALKLRVSRRNLGRAEKGEALLSWAQWVEIAKLCEATDDELALIEGMAKQADEKGWWEEYRRGLPPKFQRYVSLEMEANRLFIYETDSIAGLFQTVEYMRAMLKKNPLMTDPEQLPRLEGLRRRRQTEVLKGKSAPRIKLLVPEGVLLQEVGGPDAHARQLEHLQQLGSRRNIGIRVVRFKSGAHAAMVGSFTVLEFNSGDDADTVFVESLDGCRYVEARDVVERYRVVFDAAFAHATPLEEYLK